MKHRGYSHDETCGFNGFAKYGVLKQIICFLKLNWPLHRYDLQNSFFRESTHKLSQERANWCTSTYFDLIYRKACRPALLLLEKFESVERAPSFRAKQRKQRPHHLQITKGGQDTFQHMLEKEILLKFWPIWLCSFFSLPWHFARHNRFWQNRFEFSTWCANSHHLYIPFVFVSKVYISNDRKHYNIRFWKPMLS